MSRKKFLAVSEWADSVARMIQSGFRCEEDWTTVTAPGDPARSKHAENGMLVSHNFN
jgi:hypothetical protein